MRFFICAGFWIACVLGCAQAPFIEDDGNEVLEYFEEVAGFEYSSDSLIRRFEGDIVFFVHGRDFSFELLHELRSIIEELNGLVSNGIELSITDDHKKANFDIYFTTQEIYLDMFPGWREALEKNYGYYNVDNAGPILGSARIFVDIERARLKSQRHLLREELTQAMGLGRDSPRYPRSVFYDGYVGVTEYLPIDRELIKIMYDSRMESGITLVRAVELARKILNE